MIDTTPGHDEVEAEERTDVGRRRSVFREIALWIGALIGVICIVTSVGAFVFGLTPLVFRSGSMSPGIPTGSLALAVRTPAAQLHVGDIVSVEWSNTVRVTHRIVAIDGSGSTVRLTTRGDANDTSDAEQPVVSAADRVIWSVPWWGFAYEELSKPQYVFFGGVIGGMLLLAALRTPARDRRNGRGPRTPRPARRPRARGDSIRALHPRHATGLTASVATETTLDWRPVVTRSLPLAPDLDDTRPAGGIPRIRRGLFGRMLHRPAVVIPVVTALVAVLGAGALVGTARPTDTLALFTDSGKATSAPFTSTTLAPPPFETCAVVGTSLLTSAIRLTWTAPAGTAPSEYRIVYTVGGGSRQVIVVPSGTLTGDIPLSLLGISLGSSAVYSIKIASAIGGSGGTGGWEVPSAKTATATVTLSLAGLVGGSCTVA